MQVLEVSDGQRIPVGQLYRDNHDSDIRTLRVDGAASEEHVQLMVVRHEVDGRVSEPMRATVLPIDALLSAAFVPVDNGEGR